ncbi:MAG: exodeoxyribonuclease VII large subunit [Clostridia bacterium]|nr:exodeoxyribonuclease VII large subunit [Clostridia bacterium]
MQVFTVSQINNYVKTVFDSDAVLSEIVVTGEISNLKFHSSGHIYLTLKDESAAISAAMFKWNAKWMRFTPENGMKVIAHGKVTLYEPTGQYQIVLSSMQPDGSGDLHLAFEQLKKRLEEEGLFDYSKKKKIPEYPERVGVVTSKTGAAVQDIINAISRRYPPADIVLCPVQVQGSEASAQIAAAIATLNEGDMCDVIIVGRGGGSIEDLWPFNTEPVVRAVAASHIPIISAVGHETDFTLCDFAADLRAPTPSAAAELSVPDKYALMDYLSALRSSCQNSMKSYISNRKIRLDSILSKCNAYSPQQAVSLKKTQLDSAIARIRNAADNKLESCFAKLTSVCSNLAALNPMSVISRGYCIASLDDKPIKSSHDIKKLDRFDLIFSDGTVSCRALDDETERY